MREQLPGGNGNETMLTLETKQRDDKILSSGEVCTSALDREGGIEEKTFFMVDTGFAHIVTFCNYGGGGSKYEKNEDTACVGVDKTGGHTVCLTVDGAGGMGNGRTFSVLATSIMESRVQQLNKKDFENSLSSGLLKMVNEQIFAVQHGIREDTKFADKSFLHAGGAAVCACIDHVTGQVQLEYIGDSKIMTVCDGSVLQDGTTVEHNVATEMLPGNKMRYLLDDPWQKHETYWKNLYRKKMKITDPYRDITNEQMDRFVLQIKTASVPENIFGHPLRHMITRSLGRKSDSIDTLNFKGKEGDVLVLASDGLWDVVSEYEVERILTKGKADGKSLEDMAQTIFQLAFDRNNSIKDFQIEISQGQLVTLPFKHDNGDNITIQVVELKKTLQDYLSECVSDAIAQKILLYSEVCSLLLDNKWPSSVSDGNKKTVLQGLLSKEFERLLGVIRKKYTDVGFDDNGAPNYSQVLEMERDWKKDDISQDRNYQILRVLQQALDDIRD